MRIIVCFLVCLVAAPVWAEWLAVSVSDSLILYIDPGSIRKNGYFRKVWEVQDLKQPGQSGEMSWRALEEYDCKEEQSRILALSTHSKPMAGGETLWLGDGAGKWSAIPPGSLGAAVFKRVCAK